MKPVDCLEPFREGIFFFGNITVRIVYYPHMKKNMYWMEINSGPRQGEGMSVEKETLNNAIERFYKENF